MSSKGEGPKPSAQASNAQYHGDSSMHQAPQAEAGYFGDFKGILSHAPELYNAYKSSAQGMNLDTAWQAIAALPEESHTKARITTAAVDLLWNKLKHPPLSYLGDKFQYRTPDGSFNSVITPSLGQAKTPYAKSVPGSVALHGAKPDPGDLFDLLMARDPKSFVPNPKGLSSMILYHATIVIHDVFRTSEKDPNISDTSSYLDLAPLYGSSLVDQVGSKESPHAGIRKMEKGLLKPDSFAEKRLLGQPPGVCALLVMYNRFHNYVAEQLLAINDNGRFSIPDDLVDKDAKAALQKQDDDLFNTARLVTCGLYASISVFDYLRGFMGVHSANTSWTLDPRQEIGRKYDGQGVPRGIGNQVSVEFNLLYRFHSAISERDAGWTEKFFQEIFPGKDVTTMPLKEFSTGIRTVMASISHDPFQRSFHGVDGKRLQRGPDGKFDDEDLVKIIQTGIEDPAGAFGARNVPKVLRVVEILGILQARKWQVCSLNEFRTFFGMKPHATFKDINPDTDIANALTDLYEHPDMVELYPGLFCEGNGRNMDPGTEGTGGLAMWTGVFSDAVTLVRSDRFYTVDWTVTSLTAWGMKEVSSNSKVLKGSMFYKLIQRAFPGWFKYDSIHFWQPMYTPTANKKYADKQKLRKLFVDNGPHQPTKPTNITDYDNLLAILGHHREFKNPAFSQLHKLDPGPVKDFLQTIDELVHDVGTNTLADVSNEYGDTEKLFSEYFSSMAKFIEERERCKWVPRNNGATGTFQIDVTRDFAIPIIVRFVGDILGLNLSGVTDTTSGMSETQFYRIITDYQHFLNYNDDETTTWKRRAAFLESMKTTVETLQALSGIKGAISHFFGYTGEAASIDGCGKELRAFGAKLAEKLKTKGKMKGMTSVFLIALEGAYNTVLMFTEILNFFLDTEEGQQAWPKVQKLAGLNNPESNRQIKKYVMEAQRITLNLPIVRVAQESGTIEVKDSKTKAITKFSFEKGEKFVLQLGKASHDPTIFPEPAKIDLNRDPTIYVNYGHQEQSLKAEEISTIALTAMIKFAATMRNLRPGNDTAGSLKKVTQVGGAESYMTPDWAEFVPYPTTWKLRYDDWDGPYVPYPKKSKQNHDVTEIYRPNGPSHDGGTFNNNN